MFIRKSVENGIDIIRIFDALNDVRNIEVAVDETLKCGAHASGTICYTISPIHNLDNYVKLAKQIEALGVQSICVKDMAGIMSPKEGYDLVKALKANDVEKFGKLMNESHVSLRDDYEVTGIELDTLAEAAWAQEGVIGSRMTGAGFGGCTVSIVKNECIDNFIKNVGEIYLSKIGYAADFYVVEIGDGAKEI
jgi:pyruvate carboxylase